MAQIHTHYDNLMVARNAPPEVIRAAYKTLTQKYHPDRNPGNVEAARIMAIINTSYEVLSDSKKRQEHDIWVAQQERAPVREKKPSNHTQQSPQQAQTQPLPDIRIGEAFLKYFGIGLIAFFIWIWVTSKPNNSPQNSKLNQTNAASMGSSYVRPITAPNGQPWPIFAGYIDGYEQLHAEGLSTVTVDNSRNDTDVFVKLFSIDSAQVYPARQFYIPALSSLTLNNVTAGNYDIRYRDLSNGGLSRSEAFNLEETSTDSGIQFSNITMTLYKIANGNMQTYGLTEAEF